MPDTLVSFDRVTKRFGEVVANRAVSFGVAPGEVLALVGENGAGKSTVVNMLAGLIRPDEGRIAMGGSPVGLASPVEAVRAGIGVVHQHFALVPTLSVLDNVALGMGELGLGRLDRRLLDARVAEVCGRLGFRLDGRARIDTLDVAQQQQVEIVKALMHEVRLLLLDEPTAVLTPEDKLRLFETIRRLKARNAAVILITHKLEDVFAIADRAVIMRRGAVVEDRPVGELTPASIVSAMIGEGEAAAAEAIALGAQRTGGHGTGGPVLASLREVELRRPNGSVAVAGATFDIRAGEILAVAGVDGNGQSELVLALAGMARPAAGTIECLGLGSASPEWTPGRLRRRGLAHIPEDRRRDGIVADMTLTRNFLLTRMQAGAGGPLGLLRERAAESHVARLLERFSVRCEGPRDRIGRLSGGNQQKVVLAREMDGDPRLILAAHPSRGLDIKTIRFVHELLERARSEGRGVLLVSSDLDEILHLADRIVAFAAGRAVGPASRGAVTRAELGAWIAGHGEAA